MIAIAQLPIEAENLPQVPPQLLDVIADAAHAELAEVGEVLPDLRGVEVELLGKRLRRHRPHAGRIERRSGSADRRTDGSSSAPTPARRARRRPDRAARAGRPASLFVFSQVALYMEGSHSRGEAPCQCYPARMSSVPAAEDRVDAGCQNDRGPAVPHDGTVSQAADAGPMPRRRGRSDCPAKRSSSASATCRSGSARSAFRVAIASRSSPRAGPSGCCAIWLSWPAGRSPFRSTRRCRPRRPATSCRIPARGSRLSRRASSSRSCRRFGTCFPRSKPSSSWTLAAASAA